MKQNKPPIFMNKILNMSPVQIVKILIYINIGIYILSLMLNRHGFNFSINPLKLLSPENRSLISLGATGTIPVNRLHRFWSFVSANFLHANIVHIFFNMVALWQLSPLVIREYGINRFLSIYLLGGSMAYYFSYLAGVKLTIGASTALCSLIGALLYFGKSRGGEYGALLFKQVSYWVLIIFIFGFAVPGINNWGHGGGILAGIILGFVLGYKERTRENIFHKILAAGSVAGCGIILVYALISGIVNTFVF